MSNLQKLNYLKETNPHWSNAFFTRLERNVAQLNSVYFREISKPKKQIKKVVNNYEDSYQDFLNSREHQDWLLNMD